MAPPSQRQNNGNEHSWLPVFSPSHAQTLLQTKELQRPLNSTLGARSAKTRAQCSYTLKTAKRELATPKGHSSQPPSGRRHRWPPLQPLSPSSPPPSWLWQCCHLPLTMLCCLSPSKSGVLYSHQLLCKPRPVLYTLSSVK